MRSRISRFTLIELVVSIALLMAVAAITAMSGAAFYNGYQRSLRVTEELRELMAIDNLMDTHIRNLIPFKWKDDEGTSRLIFNGDENELFFATLRRSYGKRPGALLFIRIFVENDELIAEYSPYPRFPWLEEQDENMPWEREVIARNVAQVTFAYAETSAETEGGVEFLETYLEEDISSPPLAVKMTVEWHNGRKEQWLRRVAGSAANTSFGVRTALNSDSATAATGSTSAQTSVPAPAAGQGSGRSGGSGRFSQRNGNPVSGRGTR